MFEIWLAAIIHNLYITSKSTFILRLWSFLIGQTKTNYKIFQTLRILFLTNFILLITVRDVIVCSICSYCVYPLWPNYFCTTVACFPPIRGLEKCRVIGHNLHFSSLCSLSCLKPKVLPKGILFSACDWWKAVNCGTSHIDSSEVVEYGIPLGLLGSAS